MRNQNLLLLPFAVALISLMTVGCASTGRVDKLENDIRVLGGQQQSAEADVTQRLSDIDERMNAADQRLTELAMVASELSKSDDDIKSRMSEIESRLDERAINRIFVMPLTYAVAITILLFGILLGVWGYRWKAQRDLS